LIHPFFTIDLHITDLLPQDPTPTRADTFAYRVNDDDVKRLTERVLTDLGDAGLPTKAGKSSAASRT
jgi:hypothetical protein